MAEDSSSQSEISTFRDSQMPEQQPAELDETNRNATNPLVSGPIDFKSAAISSVTFLGSGFILLSILFSPEIAIAMAFHFIAKH